MMYLHFVTTRVFLLQIVVIFKRVGFSTHAVHQFDADITIVYITVCVIHCRFITADSKCKTTYMRHRHTPKLATVLPSNRL